VVLAYTVDLQSMSATFRLQFILAIAVANLCKM